MYIKHSPLCSLYRVMKLKKYGSHYLHLLNQLSHGMTILVDMSQQRKGVVQYVLTVFGVLNKNVSTRAINI